MHDSTTARRLPPTTPTRPSRRNTVDSSPIRNRPIIQRVKVAQKGEYAHAHRDDHTSFDRITREEEERVQYDMERAMRAKRREAARKATRRSLGSKDTWNPADHVVYSPNAMPPSQRGPLRPKENFDRGRLDFSFKFPHFRPESEPPQPELLHTKWCPPSPTKRLAPLAPFHPFRRQRSESMSSVVERGPPSPAKHKRNASVQPRAAPVQKLFDRIHAEARRQGFQI